MKAVILAGGLGSRLRPFTTTFPKPLMPLGDVPIIEILLRQLRAHGVDEAILLTGHLAYLIEGYLGDGRAMGMTIRYVRETSPRGTAGPLRQLAGQLNDDFLVVNGDLLTDVDYGALMEYHRQAGASLTISTYRREERIELGVLTIDDRGGVLGYDEKPTMAFNISMGLYAMSPSVLARIPDGHYDMPVLVEDLIAAGVRVAARRHDGFWLDIGRPDDYARANELISSHSDRFMHPEGIEEGASRGRRGHDDAS